MACVCVCRRPVRSAMRLPAACMSTRGDLFLCVSMGMCVCVCVLCCRQGKSLSSLCLCEWMSLWEFPRQSNFCSSFIRFLHLWLHSFNILFFIFLFAKHHMMSELSSAHKSEWLITTLTFSSTLSLMACHTLSDWRSDVGSSYSVVADLCQLSQCRIDKVAIIHLRKKTRLQVYGML